MALALRLVALANFEPNQCIGFENNNYMYCVLVFPSYALRPSLI